MDFEEYFREWLRKSHWLRLGLKDSGFEYLTPSGDIVHIVHQKEDEVSITKNGKEKMTLKLIQKFEQFNIV